MMILKLQKEDKVWIAVKEVRSSDFGYLFSVLSFRKILHHILILFLDKYFAMPKKP